MADILNIKPKLATYTGMNASDFLKIRKGNMCKMSDKSDSNWKKPAKVTTGLVDSAVCN